ncbi:MAG: hypothetical protein GDA36_14080 [Rhodobacteraceae bacterium]|nr:hypothetical protein [Paracoccaceae bacterium]
MAVLSDGGFVVTWTDAEYWSADDVVHTNLSPNGGALGQDGSGSSVYG